MRSPKSILSQLKERLGHLRITHFSSGDEIQNFPLSEEELIEDLDRHAGNQRLLGRFNAEEVGRALEHYEVWTVLKEKGFPNPKLVLRGIDPYRQSLKILTSQDAPEDEEHLLCELRVFDAYLKGPCPITNTTFEMDALVIDWLTFQNPNAPITPDRALLPGQKYPGLGIMRICMRAIIDLAKQIGKEAVINIPEYYHNAVLYRPAFRFFSAYVEGRFLALQDFLSGMSLAEASRAVAEQRIWNEARKEVFVWKPHEQVLGLSPRVRDYFASVLYDNKAEEARKESRFQLVLS